MKWCIITFTWAPTSEKPVHSEMCPFLHAKWDYCTSPGMSSVSREKSFVEWVEVSAPQIKNYFITNKLGPSARYFFFTFQQSNQSEVLIDNTSCNTKTIIIFPSSVTARIYYSLLTHFSTHRVLFVTIVNFYLTRMRLIGEKGIVYCVLHRVKASLKIVFFLTKRVTVSTWFNGTSFYLPVRVSRQYDWNWNLENIPAKSNYLAKCFSLALEIFCL